MSWIGAIRLYGVPEKMTRRLLGLVLGTQGLAVFFGAVAARGLASAEGAQSSGSLMLFGSLLAVLCIVDAGLLRRRWGITAGWILQAATLACTLVVPLMLPVGLLFAALWLTALIQGRAMDRHTRRVDAQWHAQHETPARESSAQEPSAQEPSAQESPPQERS